MNSYLESLLVCADFFPEAGLNRKWNKNWKSHSNKEKWGKKQNKKYQTNKKGKNKKTTNKQKRNQKNPKQDLRAEHEDNCMFQIHSCFIKNKKKFSSPLALENTKG